LHQRIAILLSQVFAKRAMLAFFQDIDDNFDTLQTSEKVRSERSNSDTKRHVDNELPEQRSLCRRPNAALNMSVDNIVDCILISEEVGNTSV